MGDRGDEERKFPSGYAREVGKKKNQGKPNRPEKKLSTKRKECLSGKKEREFKWGSLERRKVDSGGGTRALFSSHDRKREGTKQKKILGCLMVSPDIRRKEGRTESWERAGREVGYSYAMRFLKKGPEKIGIVKGESTGESLKK